MTSIGDRIVSQQLKGRRAEFAERGFGGPKVRCWIARVSVRVPWQRRGRRSGGLFRESPVHLRNLPSPS